MSLFTKNIGEIQFSDISNFVGIRLREDRKLDYKEDFPTDLAKTVIAFANTVGGIILIGVKANKNTNQPEEIPGIPLSAGLEEKVTNITMSHIEPPISPEVKVCPFKSNAGLTQDDRAVVVIRVSQSDIAPHSDSHSNAIWIRNHSTCNQASLDVIERLLERRDKGALLREEMEQGADQVVTNALPGFPLTNGRIRYYEIRLLPLYPLKITFNKSTDDFLRGQIGSICSINEVSLKPGGIDFISRNQTTNRPRRFFSFSRNGFLVHIEPLEMPTPDEVYAERVIQILAKMLRASVRIYEHFGYFGRLSVQVLVGGARGMKLLSLIPRAEANPFDDPRMCQEDNIKTGGSYSLDEIKTDETAILGSVYNDLLRGFQIVLENATLTWRLNNLVSHLP
jgi:hypothetical protein